MPRNLNFSSPFHAFALFCFILAIYLSVGGWLQEHYGLWGMMVNEVGILLFPALVYAKVLGLGWKTYFPLRWPDWRDFLLTLLMTAVVIAAVEAMIHYQEKILPTPESLQKFYEELTHRDSWQEGVVQFFALVLVPAFCEELFFRGLLQKMFEDRLGATKAVLLTALFFAVAHLNPWYLVYYFFLGVFLGWLRHWRDNVGLCILAHFLNNFYSLYA